MIKLTKSPTLIDAPVAIDEALIDAALRAMSPNSWQALQPDLRFFGD